MLATVETSHRKGQDPLQSTRKRHHKTRVVNINGWWWYLETTCAKTCPFSSVNIEQEEGAKVENYLSPKADRKAIETTFLLLNTENRGYIKNAALEVITPRNHLEQPEEIPAARNGNQ